MIFLGRGISSNLFSIGFAAWSFFNWSISAEQKLLTQIPSENKVRSTELKVQGAEEAL